VSKTHLDIDDELLSRTAALLRTGTKRETVHEALRRVVQQEERRAAVLAERDRGRSGYYAALGEDDAWHGQASDG